MNKKILNTYKKIYALDRKIARLSTKSSYLSSIRPFLLERKNLKLCEFLIVPLDKSIKYIEEKKNKYIKKQEEWIEKLRIHFTTLDCEINDDDEILFVADPKLGFVTPKYSAYIKKQKWWEILWNLRYILASITAFLLFVLAVFKFFKTKK